MDLSSVHGNKLQMRFSHHKLVDVRVQIKEMFLFFPIFSYFSAFLFLFSYFLQVIWHLTPCDIHKLIGKLPAIIMREKLSRFISSLPY